MSEQKLVIDEVGTVAERINKLVDHFCKGNKTAFGRAADIQSGVLAGIVGGRGSKPGFEILQKLLTAYPSVEPTWLLFGRGPMLQNEPIEPMQQSVPPISVERIESILKETIITQLGLDLSVRRGASEATIRAKQIAELELQTLEIRMQIDALNHRAVVIRNSVSEEGDEQVQLASIGAKITELYGELNGKHQLSLILKQEDERVLQQALQGIHLVTQHVVQALSTSTDS